MLNEVVQAHTAFAHAMNSGRMFFGPLRIAVRKADALLAEINAWEILRRRPAHVGAHKLISRENLALALQIAAETRSRFARMLIRKRATAFEDDQLAAHLVKCELVDIVSEAEMGWRSVGEQEQAQALHPFAPQETCAGDMAIAWSEPASVAAWHGRFHLEGIHDKVKTRLEQIGLSELKSSMERSLALMTEVLDEGIEALNRVRRHLHEFNDQGRTGPRFHDFEDAQEEVRRIKSLGIRTQDHVACLEQVVHAIKPWFEASLADMLDSIPKSQALFATACLAVAHEITSEWPDETAPGSSLPPDPVEALDIASGDASLDTAVLTGAQAQGRPPFEPGTEVPDEAGESGWVDSLGSTAVEAAAALEAIRLGATFPEPDMAKLLGRAHRLTEGIREEERRLHDDVSDLRNFAYSSLTSIVNTRGPELLGKLRASERIDARIGALGDPSDTIAAQARDDLAAASHALAGTLTYLQGDAFRHRAYAHYHRPVAAQWHELLLAGCLEPVAAPRPLAPSAADAPGRRQAPAREKTDLFEFELRPKSDVVGTDTPVVVHLHLKEPRAANEWGRIKPEDCVAAHVKSDSQRNLGAQWTLEQRARGNYDHQVHRSAASPAFIAALIAHAQQGPRRSTA